MTTTFFDRQDTARRNTGRLVALFFLAVVAIVGVTSTVAFMGMQAAASGKPDLRGAPIPVAILVGLGTLALIALGTTYKVIGLRMGGGKNVAESVGGKQLSPNSNDLEEQRVMNVVEEMAIASGTPVPPVYLMDEDSINAFAAGYSPSDAVIGVTRGAVRNLTRDELQGVIAHEFSHVLNGDMRINIRLIGILHGILLMHLLGSMLVRSLRFAGGSSRGGKNNSGQIVLVILAIGVALFILGWIGHVIGGMIKAAVSRQREYLADASAVQFTRNPSGIAGALKRIGGLQAGSKIEHPGAELVSHMYFAEGIAAGFSNMMATHPPLQKRILAIEPNWDGSFKPSGAAAGTGSAAVSHAGAAGFAGTGAPPPIPVAEEVLEPISVEVTVEEVRHASEQIGSPDEEHQEYASQLLSSLPAVLVEAAHEPYTSRALVFALLLDRKKEIRIRQLKAIGELTEDYLVKTTHNLSKVTDELPEHARLPLLDMTLPALRMMSPSQYVDFMRAFAALADADDRHSVFEWALAQVLIRHLKPQYVPIKAPITQYYNLKGLVQPVSVLMSVMSRVGHGDEWVQPAFEQGRKALKGLPIQLLSESECSLRALHMAMNELKTATAKVRGQLVDACAYAISADGKVTVSEAELLRGIADLLDCPVPPWVDAAYDS